jgi:hypothetical protein
VRILLRADSGFAREELMSWCEANRIDFVFGLARNSRLVEEIAVELLQAEEASSQTGKPARRYKDFRYATLDTWSRRRRVVGKAEWTKGEANPRFIVTSLGRAKAATHLLYEDIYCARGEMENRIKECQGDLFADRTSTATMTANQLRLWFASMAYVLICALRRIGLAHTPVRKRLLRHNPPEAPQDRRPRHHQRASHQVRHGLRQPLCRPLAAGRSTPRPCPRLAHLTRHAAYSTKRGTNPRPTGTPTDHKARATSAFANCARSQSRRKYASKAVTIMQRVRNPG